MLGMSEEQFWRSNPAIIEVWEEAWKLKEKRKNELAYMWVGNYGISALQCAIDHCLNGRKAKAEYLDKPLQLFDKTEKEKKEDQKKALDVFVAWANFTKDDFDRKNK